MAKHTFGVALLGLLGLSCTRTILIKLSEPKLKAAYQDTSEAFADAGWACDEEKWNDGSKWLRCKNGRDILLLGFDLVDGRASVTFVSPWEQPNCKAQPFRAVVDKFNREVPLASCECVSEHVLLIWTSMPLPDEGLPRQELPVLARKWHKVVSAEAAKAHLLDE